MSTYRPSIFDELSYKDIKRRVENLREDAERQWGKMTIAQMLAHCSASAELLLGKLQVKDKSTFMSRTLIRWFVLRAVKKHDLGKDQPTLGEFRIEDERDFQKEKTRLLMNLDEMFYTGNRATIGPHPYFGKFTNKQWGELQYEHLDHHLSQFSS